jgi:hypothetical protein
LWDNGTDAVAELQRVMLVRQKAMQQFGEKNVRPGMPMAFLEDALVPVYFYHRYQLESAVKLVGGADYRYALRGDGQPTIQWLPKEKQEAALQALMGVLDPSQLTIPTRIADLIPPRPAGYEFNRELFRKRTGLSFDRLTPAETVADVTFSFLFHPERLNRLVQQKSTVGFGADDMVQQLISSTWMSPRRSGFDKQIQQQTEQVLLTYLLSASVNEENGYEVKAAMTQALEQLKSFVESQKKTATGIDAGHYQLALDRMKAPEKSKPTIHKEIPPGAPIGCEE